MYKCHTSSCCLIQKQHLLLLLHDTSSNALVNEFLWFVPPIHDKLGEKSRWSLAFDLAHILFNVMNCIGAQGYVSFLPRVFVSTLLICSKFDPIKICFSPVFNHDLRHTCFSLNQCAISQPRSIFVLFLKKIKEMNSMMQWRE